MESFAAGLLCWNSSPAINPCPVFPLPSNRFSSSVRWNIMIPRSGISFVSGNGTLIARCSKSPGLYSSEMFELTVGNVDLVLEDVRPYLISDGGNVEVVSVEDGIISLRLQGACGSCPSSTTTMTMGIERVLREKFGKEVREIRQVSDEQQIETTAEAVNRHLDILRPAIKNYGGRVEVISVDSDECHVSYVGPESIGNGIRAAIKERFPEIQNVIFSG